MGGYQSALNGLYCRITFVAIHRPISTLARCNHRKAPIINNCALSSSIFTIKYMTKCFNCICLVKTVHSSAKLRWFHLFISHGRRVPTSIVKNVKNRSISNKSATGRARATRRSPNDTQFASPINSLHTGVDPMSIRPVVPEI